METFLNLYLSLAYNVQAEKLKHCSEFARRAEEALLKYKEASKYPRKKKKKLRKEAIFDYNFYNSLSQQCLLLFNI